MEPGEVRRDSRDFAVRGSSCAPAALRLFADGRPAFLVVHGLVKNLPNQAMEPVGDRTDGLGVAEARTSRRYTIAKIVPFAFTAALASD